MSDLVADAIASTPSVVFFDELDSFGSRDAPSNGHNSRYMTAIINDLLQQLTRLNQAEGVIVIAATNNPQHVDPAIVRSGRFDLKLPVGHPNKKGITQILTSHLGAPDLIDAAYASGLVGCSGAELANIARRAKGHARRDNAPLDQAHLSQAIDAALPERSQADLIRIATHEAGHVVVAAMLGLPLPQLARVSRNGGAVLRDAPLVFTAQSTKLELAYWLGGRAAEQLICGDASSGSGAHNDSDLDAATALVLEQELMWGLGRNGLAFTPIERQDRFKMSPILRSSVNKTLASAEDLARDTLTKNRDLLEFVTQALLDERELNNTQIAMLFTPADGRGTHVSKELQI